MSESRTAMDLDRELANGEAARIIRRKARRMVGHQRLTSDDQPDIEQELMIAVFEAYPKFDPTVAEWPAFVSTVVERRAGKILRRRKARRRKPDQQPTSLSENVLDGDGDLVPLSTQLGDENREAMTGCFTANEQDLVDLRVDVDEFLAELPADLRELCQRLKRQSICEIARETGTPRRTLRDKVLQLKQRFIQAGFDDFLQESPAI